MNKPTNNEQKLSSGPNPLDPRRPKPRGRPLGSKNKIKEIIASKIVKSLSHKPQKRKYVLTKEHKGRFTVGNKGGPGRAEGSRHSVSLLIEEMGMKDAGRVYQHMVALSLGEKDKGDIAGCRYIVERLCPPRKGYTLDPDLSKDIRQVKTEADINAASEKITQMVLEGLLSVEEADGLCRVLDHRLKILTDTDVLRKIEETCTKVDSLCTDQ